MDDRDQVNRRDFIATTAGAASVATGLASTAALAQPASKEAPPDSRTRLLSSITGTSRSMKSWMSTSADAAPELTERGRQGATPDLLLPADEADRPLLERQQGGPLGAYPWRAKQIDRRRRTDRYRGDMADEPGSRPHQLGPLSRPQHRLRRGRRQRRDHRLRFQPQRFFRSTAEHAESRMVRRLFSLADIFDSWRTGRNAARQVQGRLAQRRHPLHLAGILRAVLRGDVARPGQADHLSAERLHRLQDRQHHVQSGQCPANWPGGCADPDRRLGHRARRISTG